VAARDAGDGDAQAGGTASAWPAAPATTLPPVARPGPEAGVRAAPAAETAPPGGDEPMTAVIGAAGLLLVAVVALRPRRLRARHARSHPLHG
jgi:hypothetical protein